VYCKTLRNDSSMSPKPGRSFEVFNRKYSSVLCTNARFSFHTHQLNLKERFNAGLLLNSAIACSISVVAHSIVKIVSTNKKAWRHLFPERVGFSNLKIAPSLQTVRNVEVHRATNMILVTRMGSPF
jgi:hypothetical protein